MPSANDIQGTVFANATATFLARVEDSSGANLQQADVTAITYTVSAVGPDESAPPTTILGHENLTLDKTAVIQDTLQADSTWSVDATGYSFRHEIDVSSFEAFPQSGVVYQVRYEITPTTGQKIVFRFRVRCI